MLKSSKVMLPKQQPKIGNQAERCKENRAGQPQNKWNCREGCNEDRECDKADAGLRSAGQF